jgi:hypothetical protein
MDMATKKAQTANPTAESVQDVDYITVVKQTGDTVLSALTEVQENMLKAAETITAQLPAVPEFNVPGVQSTDPKLAREIVAANFAFAEEYLANQKSFAEKWLKLAGV